MSSLLYVHDLPFILAGEVCYSASFTDEYFERFLMAGFDRLDIVSRVAIDSLNCDGYNFLNNESVKVSRLVGSGYRNLLRPSVFISLWRLAESSDLVVISTPSVNGVYASILCLLLGKRYVCEVAGDYTAFETKKFGRTITLLLRFYMPWLVRKAVGATYVTNDLAKKYPNANFFVGSNVNIHHVFPRSSYALKRPEVVSVGFVGGLVERKGIRTIIQAAALLKRECQDKSYIFNFIGGHADYDWEALCVGLDVSDVCIFHGMKKRAEIDVLLGSFDLYVQPSFSEGVPRAAIEAMSHGLPVIASTLPGFFEILPAEVLVTPGGASVLAEKIRNFAKNESVRKKHGERNLERAKSFLFKEMNEARVGFYKGVRDLLRL